MAGFNMEPRGSAQQANMIPKSAAVKIDQGIAKVVVKEQREKTTESRL